MSYPRRSHRDGTEQPIRDKRKSRIMQTPIRVLIVDDQPRARKSVKALLSTWTRSAEVREASNGREALRLAEELPPDLVLMDVRMPEMDGLEATGQIKTRWPQVKVIVLSMYIEHEDEALAARADAFVGKGEAPDALLGILSALVEKG
jgi:DNA-binding NarL/FixJ family response regulator